MRRGAGPGCISTIATSLTLLIQNYSKMKHFDLSVEELDQKHYFIPK